MKFLDRNQLQVWMVALSAFGLMVGCSDKKTETSHTAAKTSKPKQAKVAQQVSKKPPVQHSSGPSMMKLVPPSKVPPARNEPAPPVKVVHQTPTVTPTPTVEPAEPRPASPVEVAKPRPAPEPKVVEAAKPTPPKATPLPQDDKEAQRQEKEDLIYATIRVRMEEMIQERKDLLAAGKPPHDQEVRRLEGSIMRARNLLIEHGEEVDDVEPPIVRTRSQ